MKYDKETILYGHKQFSHLIRMGKRLSNYDFAQLIKKHYLLSNPIINKVFNEIRNASDLYFETNKIVRI